MSTFKTLLIVACIFTVLNADMKQKKKIAADASKIVISDNNRLVAGLQNKTVLVYDKNFNVIASMEQDNPMSAVGWRSNHMAIGAAGEDVRVYDTDSWEHLYNTTDYYYRSYQVDSIDFSPDGAWMAVGCKYYVDIYLVAEKGPAKQLFSQEDFQDITDVAFSPDGNILTSTSGKSTMVMMLVGDRWNKVTTLEHNDNELTKCSISSDYLSCAVGDSRVMIYSVVDWSSVRNLTIANANTTTTWFQGNNLMSVGTKAHGVHIFNVGDWSEQEIVESGSKINDQAFSSDTLAVSYQSTSGKFIATYSTDGSSAAIKMFAVALFALLFLFV